MAFTREAALKALEGNDLLQLGMDADALRRELHGGEIATYAVLPHVAGASPEWLVQQASDVLQPDSSDLVIDLAGDDLTVDAPGELRTQVTDATDAAPLLKIERAFATLRARFPELALHGLRAADVLRISRKSGVPEEDTLRRLHAAGLGSLSGAGAGMLRDQANDWVRIHRAAHRLGMPTVAELTIGQGETLVDRVTHLQALRELQHETGGFIATRVTVHHFTLAESRREEEATAADYLKTLAVARLMLDNIPHLEGDWTVQGPKVLGLALRFGADDAGSVDPRQVERREARHHGGEAELRRIIRDAGFRPVERDALFRQSILY
jgi:cyclic dehypoxanthinyl futalosine synthase